VRRAWRHSALLAATTGQSPAASVKLRRPKSMPCRSPAQSFSFDQFCIHFFSLFRTPPVRVNVTTGTLQPAVCEGDQALNQFLRVQGRLCMPVGIKLGLHKSAGMMHRAARLKLMSPE